MKTRLQYPVVVAALACLLVLGAGGCRERRRPAEAAPPAAQASNAPSSAITAVAPSEPTTNVEASSIVEIPASEVAVATASTAPCSFDSVDDVFFKGTTTVSRSEPVTLRGWLSTEAKQPAGAFRLVLKADGRSFAIPATTGVARPDVADYFKNAALESAGFNVTTRLDSIPAGVYAIWLVYNAGGGAMKYCDTTKRFNLS